MGYKMKGAPMMDTSKKHGTNANYAKSGMKNADGSAVKPGAPGFFGNLMRGKGALGALNPLGAIGNRLGMFGKNKNTPPPVPANPNMAPMDPNAVDPNMAPMEANAVDPNAAPVDPNAAMPAETPMYKKKKGAPMYGKKKGAPKLKGGQHKIDKNKDGKISKADFDMMNSNSPLGMYDKPAPVKNYKKGYYGA